ncbi:hypothetical protein PQC63_gp08 [Gordonia phage EricDab]|uniref:Uncharacterized protein n=1 Tax=Gordonia phage EricDab TaxID=3070616 RepID=A0A4D6E3E4_9CAUD|nr:hypothetical protein PQC63_gp08 [Gordonia phage EricDab]QBZ73179.1 hypothetical protein SEA_EPICDAB_8 [Gordonia phage EricDab]
MLSSTRKDEKPVVIENIIYTITNGAVTPEMVHDFFAGYGRLFGPALDAINQWLNTNHPPR